MKFFFIALDRLVCSKQESKNHFCLRELLFLTYWLIFEKIVFVLKFKISIFVQFLFRFTLMFTFQIKRKESIFLLGAIIFKLLANFEKTELALKLETSGFIQYFFGIG